MDDGLKNHSFYLIILPQSIAAIFSDKSSSRAKVMTIDIMPYYIMGSLIKALALFRKYGLHIQGI